MKTFPMFLRMTGRRIVIVGGGEQAAQKCRLALKTEAQITVVATGLDDELQALANAGRILHDDKPITKEIFVGAALVFIGSGCPGADAAHADLAKAGGALVNVVDQPDLCDAITPSIVDRDPVVVAIGTEGTAPVLARQIKTRVEQMLEPRLGDLAALAGRLRDSAAARLGSRDRRDLWRWVFSGAPRIVHARGSERQAADMVKIAITTGKFGDENLPQVSLVGAGAGSADLITLRGVNRLQEADIIFYDRLIDPGILELVRRDAERVYVGKAPGDRSWPQDRINGVIVAAAKQGKRVVRLKCGDPGVFARGAEEADALTAAGIDYEIVPGVTAASVAAATSGDFLTERGQTDTLILTTASCRAGDDLPNLTQNLLPGTRTAIYMGLAAAPRIEAALLATGFSHEISIDVVSDAGTQDEKRIACSPRSLTKSISENGLRNPAIIFLKRPKKVKEATHPRLVVA
ncbi:siroheme synthase CysG [Pseudaestuariivita rosea]|uniref:siroheme synthase CysG n=1 Tax=Pseudaestuariivita rosea TaxID=2763263 RepID=UPI001ABBBC2E|nr:siroheme synthase CysG [Pseudaestuariivita rosea]